MGTLKLLAVIEKKIELFVLTGGGDAKISLTPEPPGETFTVFSDIY